MMIRARARHIIAAVYRVGRRRGWFRAKANMLTVLTFHRITPPGGFHGGVRGLVNADPAPDHYQDFPGMDRIEIAGHVSADVDAVIVMEFRYTKYCCSAAYLWMS